VAGGADPVGELRQPVAAALADGRERLGVPGQLQSDLIGLTGAVPAGNRRHGQGRSINAT
jgi:hypothetical protein